MSAPATETPSSGLAHRGWNSSWAAGLVYLALSVGVWWHVWTGDPAHVTTCGCGDSSLFTWFLAWPAYALRHGMNPFFSPAMFHPAGVNLLSNTSELAFGVPLTPLNWLFGPIATLNIANTLSPALSALGMFVLLRRWVSWTPAAYLGGLLYGFSPFVLTSLADSHLMLGMLAVPPLVVVCLDELLLRQSRRPAAVGIGLGLLLVVQFFIGTEMLVIMMLLGAVGLAVLLGHALWQRRAPRADSVRPAVVGLAWAAGIGSTLLAYPAWFALAGPAHLSEPVWGGELIGVGGNQLSQYVIPTINSGGLLAEANRWGGYQGQVPSSQYFGISLLLVVLIGIVIWRQDRIIQFFAALTVVSVAFSLQAPRHGWVPWMLVAHLPIIENVISGRLSAMTYLAVAVLLGLVLDHLHSTMCRRIVQFRLTGEHGQGHRKVHTGATLLTFIVAAAALIPTAVSLRPLLPMSTQRVVLPSWYADVAPHLHGHQVVLSFPAPFAAQQAALTWQAVDGMHFAQAGGSGPESLLPRTSADRHGELVMAIASQQALPASMAGPGSIRAVRQVLDRWGVTTVAILDPKGLPAYNRLGTPSGPMALMTAAIGRPPTRQADAWVWTGVHAAGPPVHISGTAILGCEFANANSSRPMAEVPDCILRAATTGHSTPPAG